jgi:8-oxo-dGTP diphosphatase
MYHYTLGFLKRNNEILLINRERQPWKGAWNGLGGKIELGETPLQTMKRELEEETGIIINDQQIIHKGILTWNTFNALGQGLYLFLIELEPSFFYETPIKTDEGLLDFKHIYWIIDFKNEGIAKNIPYFLPFVLNDQQNYHFHCTFDERGLTSVTKEVIK